jgi:hypothetical protein
MTVPQVQGAVPSASSPSQVGRLGDGAQGLLCVRGLKLVDEQFTATFYFRDGTLSQVTLELDNKRQFEAVRPIFDRIVEALRSKYGQEVSHKEDHVGLNILDTTFMSGDTNISVLAMSVGRNPAILNITTVRHV